MKITAVGDAILTRRIPEDYAGYAELAPIIAEGDARFFNLETTLHPAGVNFGGEASGGTWLRSEPEVLDDLLPFGFDITSFNNNHVMDYSFAGLLSTLSYVEKSGLVNSGVGRDMREASRPHYLDTPKGRVALLAVNTTLQGLVCAGNETAAIPGRPGANPVRTRTVIDLNEADFAAISDIIDRSGLNNARVIERAEGYHGGPLIGMNEIGPILFKLGTETKARLEMNERDLARIKETIEEARANADYVLFSVHSHETDVEKEEPSEFLQELCHYIIDCGADAVLGHGPHLLRPIEVYRDRPILYSLGDFILQLYGINDVPADMYEQHGLSPEVGVEALLARRSHNFTIGLMEDHRMFTTIIPVMEMEGGKLTSMRVWPVLSEMDKKNKMLGLPRLSKDEHLLDDFIARCARFGTTLTREEDGSYTVTW
jgi:poly-gamma-glutamate synthesis protein (capsule biosynthesis protein)